MTDNSKIVQTAIINFIDIDDHGHSITSSGKLSGRVGDSINDLYSTEIPLKVLKEQGYRVVFDDFNENSERQYFKESVLPQIFTIGLSKKSSDNQESSDLNEEYEKLRQTREQFKQIKPTIMDSSDELNSSQTVNKLIDIITGLLTLIFMLSRGKKNKRL